jgi:hypothetical protein
MLSLYVNAYFIFNDVVSSCMGREKLVHCSIYSSEKYFGFKIIEEASINFSRVKIKKLSYSFEYDLL